MNEKDLGCRNRKSQTRVSLPTTPSYRGIPRPGTEPGSPALQAASLLSELLGKPSDSVSHSDKLSSPLILFLVWKFFSNKCTDHDIYIHILYLCSKISWWGWGGNEGKKCLKRLLEEAIVKKKGGETLI